MITRELESDFFKMLSGDDDRLLNGNFLCINCRLQEQAAFNGVRLESAHVASRQAKQHPLSEIEVLLCPTCHSTYDDPRSGSQPSEQLMLYWTEKYRSRPEVSCGDLASIGLVLSDPEVLPTPKYESILALLSSRSFFEHTSEQLELQLERANTLTTLGFPRQAYALLKMLEKPLRLNAPALIPVYNGITAGALTFLGALGAALQYQERAHASAVGMQRLMEKVNLGNQYMRSGMNVAFSTVTRDLMDGVSRQNGEEVDLIRSYGLGYEALIARLDCDYRRAVRLLQESILILDGREELAQSFRRMNIGRVEIDRGRYLDAIESLERAAHGASASEDSLNTAIHEFMLADAKQLHAASTSRDESDFRDAAKLYRNAYRRLPQDFTFYPGILENLGVCAWNLGRSDVMESCYWLAARTRQQQGQFKWIGGTMILNEDRFYLTDVASILRAPLTEVCRTDPSRPDQEHRDRIADFSNGLG